MPPREDYQTNSVDGAAAFERGRAIAEGFNDEEDYETYDEGFTLWQQAAAEQPQ